MNRDPPKEANKEVKHDLKHRLHDFKIALHRVEHKVVARVMVVSHLSYYGLVALEAHGTYRYVAGAIAVVVVIETFLGHGEPP